MKRKNFIIIRIITAIILGLILTVRPEVVINYLIIGTGIVFLAAGLFSLVSYLLHEKKEDSATRFPLDAAGAILFGLVLVIKPDLFADIVMYILGTLLILACIQQLVMLFSVRRLGRVHFGFYVAPILILLCGILLIVHPFEVRKTMVIIFGVSILIYGITELVSYIKFRKLLK